MKLGFHVSISGGIDKAVDRAAKSGCSTFQIFTRNPRSWKYKNLKDIEVEKFKEKITTEKISPVFSHMPYILNLASPVDEIYFRSIESIKTELKRCRILGITTLVTHIGSHMGSGPKKGINRVIYAINKALYKSKKDVIILIEIGSGSKNSVGSNFLEIKKIIDGVKRKDQVAVCFDTCHAFASGYNLKNSESLKNTLNFFEKTIGFDRLKLVHLNDSKGELGSGIDRHEHIGLGQIGINGFKKILNSRLTEKPMIMETPIDDRRTEIENMKIVRKLSPL